MPGDPTRSDIKAVLESAADHDWTIQDLGLLGLRINGRRDHRLHIWDPSRLDGEPPVHDHPFDFSSTVVAGQLTNTRYVEDPAGEEYVRVRYPVADETRRRTDGVRLRGSAQMLHPGDRYLQRASELHDSRQLPGTVTMIRWEFNDRLGLDTTEMDHELTMCRREESGWISGRSRPATPREVASFMRLALEWF